MVKTHYVIWIKLVLLCLPIRQIECRPSDKCNSHDADCRSGEFSSYITLFPFWICSNELINKNGAFCFYFVFLCVNQQLNLKCTQHSHDRNVVGIKNNIE